jgi:hypothetical protein
VPLEHRLGLDEIKAVVLERLVGGQLLDVAEAVDGVVSRALDLGSQQTSQLL